MKPNVIIILNRLVIGGQAVDTVPLAYYLQNYFNILILYGEKEADEVEASFLLEQYPNLQTKKIKQLRRTINPIVDLFAFFSIIQQIKKHKATIVHTHGSKSGLLGRLAAWVLHVPIIVHTFHGHLFHSYFNSIGNFFIKNIERVLAKISTYIIALSEEQYKELTQTYSIVQPNKVTIIPLGVDEKVLQLAVSDNRENFRAKFGLKETDIAVGIAGRVVPVKNHFLFLEIAKKVLDTGKQNVYFFIVGDGSVKKELTHYLAAQKIKFSDNDVNKAKIIFTSWVEDMATVYHGLDLVVLTSLNEGTPLSIIEAQFCGKPVIASNVGGVKDTFANGKSGYLIDGFSVDDYTEKLQILMNNPELRDNFSKAAISFATNTFNKQNEVLAIKNLYLQKSLHHNSNK
jgi:glycosyltransferase involved in cell wall biosynthesis